MTDEAQSALKALVDDIRAGGVVDASDPVRAALLVKAIDRMEANGEELTGGLLKLRAAAQTLLDEQTGPSYAALRDRVVLAEQEYDIERKRAESYATALERIAKAHATAEHLQAIARAALEETP